MSSGVGFLIREMHERGLRVRAVFYGVEGRVGLSDAPDGAFLLRSVPGGVPGAWWCLEAKLGEPTVEGVQIWTRDWEPAAGTLVDAVKSMSWVFEVAIAGRARAPRFAWLCCEICDMAQFVPNGDGAPSKTRKCHMTPRCEGLMRRLPDIWEVKSPRRPRKPKKTAELNPTDQVVILD